MAWGAAAGHRANRGQAEPCRRLQPATNPVTPRRPAGPPYLTRAPGPRVAPGPRSAPAPHAAPAGGAASANHAATTAAPAHPAAPRARSLPYCSGMSSIRPGSAEQEGEHGLASLVAALTALDGMGGTGHDHQLAQRRVCRLLLRPFQRGGQVAVPG